MDDLDITMQFGEWAAAERLSAAPCDDDDEINRRTAAADAIARQLAATPVAGFTGFVLKTVVLLRETGWDGATLVADVLARALLDDAVRLVPELVSVCPFLRMR